VKHLLFEFFNILRREHTHELHGVGLNEFDDFIEGTENLSILVVLEVEFLFLPDLLNLVDVGLDLRFLLRPVDELINFFGKLVELELDKIIRTERWKIEVKGFFFFILVERTIFFLKLIDLNLAALRNGKCVLVWPHDVSLDILS
jgi:hypothetical protein